MVLYDDSCSENWKELLEEDRIPYMYVYHDNDLNPDGSIKKPHYHLVLCFDGVKSDSQVKYFALRYGSANGVYQVVNSIRSMARYLRHLDNPDKYQYPRESVVCSCIDYDEVCSLVSDKYGCVADMMDWVEENNCFSLYHLMMYARTDKPDWFRALCDSSAVVMREYLKSRKWTYEHYGKQGLTGE